MKKIYLHSLVFMLLHTFCSDSFSQNWFDGNPSWYFEYYNPLWGSTDGWDKIQVQGDAICGGEPCKKLKIRSYRNELSSPASWYIDETGFIYEKDNQVFIGRNSSNLQLIFDFNLVQGDSIAYPVSSPSPCDSFNIYLIDTVGVLNINGQILKFQKYKLLTNTSTFMFFPLEFLVIEKIGALGQNYLFFFQDFSCSIEGNLNFWYGCYANEELGIFHPGSSICSPLTLTYDIKHLNISLLPNPVDEHLNIQFQKTTSGSWQLLDITGREIRKDEFNHQENLNLDTSNIPEGIYFLFLKFSDYSFSEKILVQHFD